METVPERPPGNVTHMYSLTSSHVAGLYYSSFKENVAGLH